MSLVGWVGLKYKITFDSSLVDSDLSNFIVDIVISASSGKTDVDATGVFSEVGANYKRIAFENGDSGVQCYAEIVEWDTVNNKAQIAVKIPTVSSSTDSFVYLYADNSQPDNDTYIGATGSTPSDTVNSSRVFMSHQQQDPTGSILDSSPNAKHGTSYGSMTSGDLVDGLVGKGIEYDGVDDYTNHGYNAAHDITNLLTIRVVIKPSTLLDSSLAYNVGLVGRRSDPVDTEPTYTLLIQNSTGRLLLSCGGYVSGTKSSWASGTTYVLHATYNVTGTIGELWVDGVKETLTVDTISTIAGSTNNLVIGKNNDANEFFPGVIDEVLIVNSVLSDAYIKADAAALIDNLVTFSLVSVGSSGGYSGGAPVVLPTVRQLIYLPYSLTTTVRTLVNMLYSMKLSVIVSLLYGDYTELRKIVELRYGDMALIRKVINMMYGDLSSLRNLVEINYDLQEQVRNLINLNYHMLQGELRNLVNIDYDLSIRDQLRNIVEMMYVIANDNSIEANTTLSFINENGYSLNPYHLDVDKDEGDPCIRVEMRSNDENDYESNPVGTKVTVTVNSDTYIVLVEAREISSQMSDDGQELVDVYTLRMSSPCLLLDNPYCEYLSEELTGMASEIADYVAATVSSFDDYGIEWSLLDWYIPAGVFTVNDMTPIAVLDRLASAAGGILQSKKDGTLELRPEYPNNIPDYDTDTPDIYLTEQDNFYSVTESAERYRGYNNFLVGSAEPDVEGLNVVSVELTSTRREIRVFQVPWAQSDTITLQTSGGSHVKVYEYGIKDLLIENEEVEIVDGEGSTTSPIYSIVKSDYLETDLGAISFFEDKKIQTATASNSLVKINYYTKFRKFVVEDDKIENVQFWPEVS